MGLDMYAFATPTAPEQEVDFTDEASTEIHYWRKHPNLHGWMERLYRAKGGSDQNFNCAAVVLAADDLSRLEDDLRAGRLPATEGFFFGSSDGTELDDDLKFIQSARVAQQSGLTVYYTSWW